jgi:ABC-type oligopeptide transport system substrate-binding subunit
MNLTQPPFDDIHVRKAMNWVMDKHALVQAWGGPTIGKVAHHIVPDTLSTTSSPSTTRMPRPETPASSPRPRRR